MGKYKIKSGDVFGFLTAKEKIGMKNCVEMWKCQCECGNYKTVSIYNLVSNHTTSCGCKRWKTGNRKHGLSRTRIYNIYTKMKQRCYNKNDVSYKDYGAKGITVCKEWLGKNGFQNFYNWAILNGYREDLTIDRINPYGNYEPSNCRWATYETQQNNRTNNAKIEFNGEVHTISEWAKIYDVPCDRISARLSHGWNVEKALLTPKMKNQFI